MGEALRSNGFLDQLGTLRIDGGIDVPTQVGVRPAIKATISDRRHVIGDEIVSQVIALVDRRPERAVAG